MDIPAADLFIQLHYKHLLPDLNHDKLFHLFYQMNAKSYGEKKIATRRTKSHGFLNASHFIKCQINNDKLIFRSWKS